MVRMERRRRVVERHLALQRVFHAPTDRYGLLEYLLVELS